jgi:hypothetical protein
MALSIIEVFGCLIAACLDQRTALIGAPLAIQPARRGREVPVSESHHS